MTGAAKRAPHRGGEILVVLEVLSLLQNHLRELATTARLFGELPGQQPTREIIAYLWSAIDARREAWAQISPVEIPEKEGYRVPPQS